MRVHQVAPPWPSGDQNPAPEFRTVGCSGMAFSWRCRVHFRRPAIRMGVEVRKEARTPYIVLRWAGRRRRRQPVCRPKYGAHAQICGEKKLVLKEPRCGPPPANAAEIQDKLRAGRHSISDRIRRIGGGVLRGTGAFWADRLDDVDAWPHYQVEQRCGAPTLRITGSRAEFRRPELLDRH